MNINLIVIRSETPKKLAEFYRHIGLEFDYHKHGNGSWHYSSKVGKIIFEIYPLMNHQISADNSLRLGFDVENLKELILNLKKANIEIVSEPKAFDWGYCAIIKDPDGRKIELKRID